MLALEGIKVLDLTRLGPGPFCTWILGDLGAEVIKIEAPLAAGDRQAGIFHKSIGDSGEMRRTIAYWSTNRNKKSIGLNLKSKEGLRIFYQLLEGADIVVEGFRPGVAKRLGIDFESIKKEYPGVIYCSITGYGQDGPYRNLPGHDINYIAMGGALNLIGEKDGRPVIPLNLLSDYGGAGMSAVIGILTAIMARNKTGKGQYIDIALVDSVISLLADTSVSYFQHGVELERGKFVLSGAYPYYNVYKAGDGKYITIGCLEPHLWENFCRAIDKEEFIPFHFEHAHNFSPPEGKEWEEIASFLRQHFLTKTSDEWFNLLSQKDVPVSKVYTLDETFNDPHVLHRKMVEKTEHPSEGTIEQIGIAVKLSDTPGKVRSHSPSLGEHTDGILQELGYSASSINEMRERGMIS